MNCSTIFNLTTVATTTAALYLSDKLFTEWECVLQPTLLMTSDHFETEYFSYEKNNFIIFACSNSDWKKLPLTYNQFQGIGKLTMEIYDKDGYNPAVSLRIYSGFFCNFHFIPTFFQCKAIVHDPNELPSRLNEVILHLDDEKYDHELILRVILLVLHTF